MNALNKWFILASRLMNCLIAAGPFSAIVTLQGVESGLAFDETEKVMAAAFHYEMTRRVWYWGSRHPIFCLARGEPLLEQLGLAQPIGNEVSNEVVATLRRQGHNVLPAEGCVISERGDVRVRGARALAIMLYAGEVVMGDAGSPDSVSVDVSHYGGVLVCEGNRLRLRREGDGFRVIGRELRWIC